MKKETLLKRKIKKERKKPYLLASNSNGAPEKNLSSIEIKTFYIKISVTLLANRTPSSRTRNKMKGNTASRMEFVFFLTGNVTARREKAGKSIDDDFREAEMRARRRRRKKNWRARERKREKERERLREKGGGIAHTLEAYRRTERGSEEGRSRGCRWLPIESSFSVTEEIL